MAFDLVPTQHPAPLPQLPAVIDRGPTDAYVFPIFEDVPHHCQVLALESNCLWPLAKEGEVIVYERGKFCPEPGGLRVIEFNHVINGQKTHTWHGAPTSLHVCQIWPHSKFPDDWYQGRFRPDPNGKFAGRFMTMVDGPYTYEHLGSVTRGRVLGLYRPNFSNHQETMS